MSLEQKALEWIDPYWNAGEDAFKAHGESDHFQRRGLGEAIPLLESRERAFYETLDI